MTGAREAETLSDEKLVTAFQQGEERAFDELVLRYRDRGIQMALTVTGNYEDAREVSQDAFVKLYRTLRGFRMDSRFSTWYYRVMMNAAKDFMRRKKWQKFLVWKSRETMDSFFDSVPAGSGGAQQAVLSGELGGKMTEAINGLPFRQKWVFVLRFLEGRSLREIAVATGMAEGTVKASLHFATRKFRDAIGEYWQGEE